jgi:hypothetical protein
MSTTEILTRMELLTSELCAQGPSSPSLDAAVPFYETNCNWKPKENFLFGYTTSVTTIFTFVATRGLQASPWSCGQRAHLMWRKLVSISDQAIWNLWTFVALPFHILYIPASWPILVINTTNEAANSMEHAVQPKKLIQSYYETQDVQPLGPVLSQMNPVNISTLCLFHIYLTQWILPRQGLQWPFSHHYKACDNVLMFPLCCRSTRQRYRQGALLVIHLHH